MCSKHCLVVFEVECFGLSTLAPRVGVLSTHLVEFWQHVAIEVSL